jgi:tetratricopeptide (TPR) repeat protein
LEKQGKYFKYVALVEAILTARARIYERTESHWRLWRQLAVTANVFGLKLIDEKRFSQAMQMLKNATRLMDIETSDPGGGGEGGGGGGGQTTLSPQHRNELRAFIQDSYAYYYYRRGKSAAALQYAQKAMRIHVRLRAWEHVAKCHLHIGAILSRLRRHDEAIRAMGQVLLMVEDGRLESGGASAQKICLVAVTYHNIAAEQLLLSRVHEACVSSQNARRLARLSLSYSNRWLKNFEATHKMALAALSTQREVRTKIHSKEQAQLFQDLTGTLYT